jgi:hypothetical protein
MEPIMTLHIDCTTPEKLDAFTNQLLKAHKAQKVVSLDRVAELSGTIRRLRPDQCVCRNCGLSTTGYYNRSANGFECNNQCTHDNGRSVIVFTQDDFDEYLPGAGEGDFDWLETNYPALMKAMKEKYNGELAGVI